MLASALRCGTWLHRRRERPTMRTLATLLVSSLALAAPVGAQVSNYEWTFVGALGSGQVVDETLHVVGPDGGFAPTQACWMETTTPVPIDVVMKCNYTSVDQPEYDAPVAVV